MVLGINKYFIVFLILSIVIGIGMKNWKVGAVCIGSYVLLAFIWRFLTR